MSVGKAMMQSLKENIPLFFYRYVHCKRFYLLYLTTVKISVLVNTSESPTDWSRPIVFWCTKDFVRIYWTGFLK